MGTWDMIKADRQAFADYLDGLSPAEWETQSLCENWTAKGVTLHLLVAPTVSKGQVFFAFLKSGFNLDKMSQKFIDDMAMSVH